MMVLTQLVLKASVWLISEIVLGFLGCDTLADYGESMAIAAESYIHAAEYEQHPKKVSVLST